MKNGVRCFLIVLLLTSSFLMIINSVSAEKTDVIVEFFYSEGCHSCDEKKANISYIEDYYGENISLLWLEYKDNKDLFYEYGFSTYPDVVIRNQTNITKFTYAQITTENLINTIDAYIEGYEITNPPDAADSTFCQQTPFGEVCINSSELSLPVLTIILAGIDSINPCSFFVLLFLLSLLLHTKSRKKMLIVGGLFVFFSGFIYFVLMFLIMFVFKTIEEPTLIVLIGGFVALIFGIFNIKEFFFFKKGPSTSISDEKKSKLFSQMRDLIKITSIPALIVGTIVLAISANMVELVCSLNLPVVYTGILLTYSMPDFQYILYLIIYNIIYIIPLLILVAIVVITLGRWKLSERQGRDLKLFSGLMMFSLGIVMIIKPIYLNNIFTVIMILIFSVIITWMLHLVTRKA